MKVQNHDIASLVGRLRRVKKELEKSVSSGVSEVGTHDLLRLETYIKALKDYKAWMISQPVLDLPETSPIEIELGETPDSLEMENDDLALVLNLFNILEKELVNSQSARRATGLISHDSSRFDAVIEKTEKFLTDYVGKNSPLDLPESSPMVASTGAGRTGI